MFTIRTIREYHDDKPVEVVFEAAYIVAGTDAKNVNGKGTMIEFFTGDHAPAFEPAYFGEVFVMNGAGKTVAVYRLPSGLPQRD